MKKNDIAILVLIVSISLLIAYFSARAIVGTPGAEGAEVERVTPISANVDQPNPKIFNKDAINPTVQVKIGDSSHESPFTGSDE